MPSPISPLSSTGGIRLFCFPYAGGSSQIFRKWREDFPPDIDLCPVELPGRNARIDDPPFTNLDAMVLSIADEIAPRLDTPFAVFGHSMGALVGFELVRLIARRYRRSPVHLFVAACQAPHLRDPYPAVHSLPEAELKAELRRLNGTPVEVLDNAPLMELLLPVLRADLAASETYVHRVAPALSCPITVFGGLQEAQISREFLCAWQEHTSSSCTVRMLPGDHFFIHPAGKLLLRIMVRELQKCISSAGELNGATR